MHVLMTIAVLGLLVSTAIPVLAGSFSNTGSMNAARLYHTATLLANGEVLVAGGENYTDGYLDSAELYNPATGKWTLTGTMTTKRWGPQAVLLQNGQVLVAGGGKISFNTKDIVCRLAVLFPGPTSVTGDRSRHYC